MIGIVGLGKLGLPMAVCLEGDIIGIDLRADEIINTRHPEPFLYELMRERLGNGSLVISSDYSKLRDVETVIVLVNTPEINGTFSTTQIDCVLGELSNDKFIILSSTVSPGTCAKLGVDAYVPDFVALGTVIEDFQNPSIFLVGADCPAKAKHAASVMSGMHASSVTPTFLSLKDAEYAKIFLNNYIALKISYANLISQYTDDPIGVCQALGKDPRIGKKYFKPGLPWGGQCFPRDVSVLTNMGGLASDLGCLIDNINEAQYSQLLEKVKARAVGRILILGLAFKEDTDCVDNSPGTWLLNQLPDAVGYDPCVLPGLNFAEQVELADTVVIMHRRYSNYCFGDKITINPWK